jgi:hypothetical protein
MHPILEIAIGVALGMTVFIVLSWVLGMCVYIYCNKSDNIATAKKLKTFNANSRTKKFTPEPENLVNESSVENSVEDSTKEDKVIEPENKV